MNEFNLIHRIVLRAIALDVTHDGAFTAMLDIEAAHRQCPLRLDEFLNASDVDFVHDFCGIQQHMNRETGVLEDHFLPRFAL